MALKTVVRYYDDEEIERIWAAGSGDTVAQAFDGQHGIYLVRDLDADDPRNWDNLGTMVCWHRRYQLGDEDGQKYGTPDAFLLWLYNQIPGVRYLDRDLTVYQFSDRVWRRICRQIDAHYLLLPLFLYDHSGLSMSTQAEAFRAVDAAGWDWGQVGWIYVSQDRVIREYGAWNDATRQRAMQCLVGEVETYDDYLRGECYGYVLTTVVNGIEEETDSCWGFLGWEYFLTEVRRVLKHFDCSALADQL